MVSMPKRMALGFVAAAISVLTFQQGAWATFHYLDLPGLGMPPPFPLDHLPPFGVPRIVSLCFWGGLWGALFGSVWRGPRRSTWWAGIILGMAAVLTGFFIVPAVKGLPIAGEWMLNNWIKALLINGTWGLGVGLLFAALSGPFTLRDDHACR